MQHWKPTSTFLRECFRLVSQCPWTNGFRFGFSQAGEGATHNTETASAPCQESKAGRAFSTLDYHKGKREDRKTPQHLCLKSIQGAFHQKKSDRRCENHKFVGFEANLYLSTAESHYCPINFQEVDYAFLNFLSLGFRGPRVPGKCSLDQQQQFLE